MLPRGSCLWGNLVAYLLMIKQPVLIQILVARSTLQLAGCSYLLRHVHLRLYLLYQAAGVLARKTLPVRCCMQMSRSRSMLRLYVGVIYGPVIGTSLTI